MQKNGCGSIGYCRSFCFERTFMGYAGRSNIYEAAIKRMVTQALQAQEQRFYEVHAADTEEQLLTYLCRCAAALGHTPWPREIVGGVWIEQRFGTWQAALRKAKLPLPSTPDSPSTFVRIREERARQEIAYRQKKAEKKQRAQQRLRAQKEKQSV